MSPLARASYGAHIPESGGLICGIDPGSPAERAGLASGDVLLELDDEPLTDLLDWQWRTSDAERISLIARRDHQDVSVALERVPGERWGIDFAEVIFDSVRTCDNSCAFCFMRQLPGGMRPALYVRDDDFRLSFLFGNFVTLTNLSDDDIDRIAEQRLSPLYVSVHAVSPEVRRELVCARDDRTLERIDELLAEEIEIHAQIVLVPGVNDAEELDATLRWLAEREGVASVGVVPLGYTRYQERFDCSYTQPINAARVIEQVQRWQFAMKDRYGSAWVHLADEFYLNARAPLPAAEWYDGFPQLDNGIGLVRVFVDEVRERLDDFRTAVADFPSGEESVTVVTSVMAATTVAGALDAIGAAGRVRVLAVPNRFFGGNVSVTGLLTGADIASAIAGEEFEGTYLVPDAVLNSDGLTLDDMTLENLIAQSRATISLVSSDAAGLLDGLKRAAQE